MKAMKQYLTTLGLLVLSLVLFVQQMHAAGTPAGTHIVTQAKADYTTKTGGASMTAFSGTVDVTVAQLAAVNVTPATGSQTTTGDGVDTYYGFKITNSGNGPDTYNLSSVSTKSFARTFYKDDGDKVLSAAELLAGPITATTLLAADASFDVVMVVSVPINSANNGQVDVSTATATSAVNATKTATFAASTTVQTAVLTIGNGLSVSTTNAPAGGNVVYTFSVTNNGLVAATGVTFNDVIGAPLSYVSATGGGSYAAGAVSWNIGTIAPGANATVTVTVLVAAATPNATVLNNTIAVNYTTPVAVSHAVTSNNPYCAVGATGSVSIALSSFDLSVDMEDIVTLPLTVKNTGNITSVFEMTASSGSGYTWTFYKDVNNDGLFDGGDTPLTNTNGVGGVDVGVLTPGQSFKILARMTVPPLATTVDQTIDNSTLTVTSAIDATVFQSSVCHVTINTPIIDLHRSVDQANRMPGEVAVYTTTYRNIGHGKAYTLKITENEPAHSTYVPNSTYLNGVQKTDAADGDEVTVTGAPGAQVITITLGTVDGLLPATPGTVKYSATVN
jgi:uncharacterized repeat protein (TIGR01451 family)